MFGYVCDRATPLIKATLMRCLDVLAGARACPPHEKSRGGFLPTLPQGTHSGDWKSPHFSVLAFAHHQSLPEMFLVLLKVPTLFPLTLIRPRGQAFSLHRTISVCHRLYVVFDDGTRHEIRICRTLPASFSHCSCCYRVRSIMWLRMLPIFSPFVPNRSDGVTIHTLSPVPSR